ncbi:MAG: homocysteine S-methyltransferase family protein [Phycisphaeraceae bacterium]|nr:homocysteine S-methyltransferase family protein [Phycisphaeraceae bacterium]
MARPDLLKLLRQRPILCDGGMGTQLMAAGMTAGEPSARWNLDHPDVVQSVHRRYRQAGCDLLTTNTFQATRTALAQHHLENQLELINQAAVANARKGGGDDAIVLADVGPFGGFLEPVGETTEEELRDIFTQQLQVQHRSGADAVIIETMSDPREVAVAVRAAKAVADWPVIATYAFARSADGGFRTMMGNTPADALHQAIQAGADVVGANCGTDLELQDYLELAGQLVAAGQGYPVILQPNAGAPKMVDGQSVHPASAGQMAEMIRPLLKTGVRIIGGCCGTSPSHLKAMGEVLASARQK